ncbi:MAG: putative transposase [Acidimicrobiaceae bacterium]|nr:putative transposase [Acidimicrobiaceae bacterium]
MEARYRYRLRVSDIQARQLQEVFDSCRFVWNTALGRWGDLWRYEQVSLSCVDMAAELTDWRGRYDWLAALPVTPQQQVLRDLGRAVAAFYDKNNPAGRPRFKKKRSLASASWNVNGFALRDGRLALAVAGGRSLLRVVWSRPLPSPPKSVTVYRDPAGRWWASFVTRLEPDPVAATGESTGVDVGLNTFATTEFPDADVPNPRFARAAAAALARSQRNLAGKKRGSKNRAKAKTAVAKVHATVAAQRADFVHKQARTLARRFERIGVEKLQVKNMSAKGTGRAKAGLNRSIADAGWAQFLAVLDWQARKAGHQVVALNPSGTTQTCSRCGVKAKRRLGLADRVFCCEDCGLVEDRDRNAARNLNPDRWDKTVRVGQGVDGTKTKTSAERPAA